MCRLLAVKNETPFKVSEHLKKFAAISKNSKEFQGHGWGCAWVDDEGKWQHYKNIKPVWEDNLEQFSETTLLIAHARSAFQDKDIVVENNMPFYDDKLVFTFNGELHGVRIKSEGCIGAEKVFNYIKRFTEDDVVAGLQKGTSLITKQTRHVKAMNIIMADKQRVYVHEQWNEEGAYHTLHTKQVGNGFIICSAPYPDEEKWYAIPNNTTQVFQ
jgi:predicted glutamine amidotransferase